MYIYYNKLKRERRHDFNQQQGVKLSLTDAPWISCDCGGKKFTNSLMFKRVSQIISPTGKEEVIPVEVFTCDSCGKLPSFVTSKIPGVPDELKAKEKE